MLTWEWEPLSENAIKSIVDQIENLAATCPGTDKSVGDIVHLSSKPTGGTAPYTVVFNKDGTLLNQITGVTESQTVTYDYPTVTDDAGAHIFSVVVTDSCPSGSGGPKSNTESCNVNILVVAPPPSPGCNVPTCNLTVS